MRNHRPKKQELGDSIDELRQRSTKLLIEEVTGGRSGIKYLANKKTGENQEEFLKPYLEERAGDPSLLRDSTST